MENQNGMQVAIIGLGLPVYSPLKRWQPKALGSLSSTETLNPADWRNTACFQINTG